MADVIAQFFNVIGLDPAPATLAELIPYVIGVLITVRLVCCVFGIIGRFGELLMEGFRR